MIKESIKAKLDRVRPPRVQIAYDVETGGAVERREVPFVIGVLGDFSGSGDSPRSPVHTRTFRQVDFDTFERAMTEISPRVRLHVLGQVEVDLSFYSIEEFEPESLVHRVPLLTALSRSQAPEARQQLALHLDFILHAPEFQQLEAAWRELWFLVSRTESSTMLQIKFLDITKQELRKDLQRATEFDQSGLFKLLYEEPYGQFSGAPFGLLVGSYAFGPSLVDVELLKKLSAIASACHAPFIAAASPQMFGLQSFSEMADPRDLHQIVQSAEYASWNAFRANPDARYVALTLPRMLLRSPYGERPAVSGQYQHVEQIKSSQHLLWGNAAFAFASCVAGAFARYSWCAAISGIDGGGLVEGLPTWVSEKETNGFRSGIEAIITDRREKELSDLGFLPLLPTQSADLGVFFTATSCCRPQMYGNDSANTFSRLMCQLGYVLTSSRFMHYVKVMARDRIGSYVVRGDLETYLNRWIQSYVTSDDQASLAVRAKYPLREAHIDIADDPENPGSYRIVAFLRPYFQLEELSVSLRIVGPIP